MQEETIVEFDKIQTNELALEIDAVERFERIDARVKLHRAAIGLVADFAVRFSALFECSRCLEKYRTECTSDLHLVYVPNTDPHEGDDDVVLKRDDVDKIYYSGPQLDLAIGVREAIVFSMPIAPLCTEDCKGLCPVCGKSKNVHSCECTVEQASTFTPQPQKERASRKKGRRKK